MEEVPMSASSGVTEIRTTLTDREISLPRRMSGQHSIRWSVWLLGAGVPLLSGCDSKLGPAFSSFLANFGHELHELTLASLLLGLSAVVVSTVLTALWGWRGREDASSARDWLENTSIERAEKGRWTAEDRQTAFLRLVQKAKLHEDKRKGASPPMARALRRLAELGGQGYSSESLTMFAAADMKSERLKGSRQLGVSKAVASIAPFVGLVGTVSSVVVAIGSMSDGSGAGGFSDAYETIADALVATALALVVAIIAVFAHHYSARIVSTRLDEVEYAADNLIAMTRAMEVYASRAEDAGET